MTDKEIITLFWKRDENAINETKSKYNRYLFKIAQNFLSNREDCDETLNDTYLKVWNRIPPHNPESLSVFLAKITRESAIDLLRNKERQKRKHTQYSLSLDELAECVSGNENPEDLMDYITLAQSINKFLLGITPEKRSIFISRYFYADSLKAIASRYSISLPKLKSKLYRTRLELKEYLEKEGFNI